MLALNGRPASELISANDFSLLTAERSGQTLALLLQGTGGQRTVTLAAAVYRLSPVPRSAVVYTPGGRPVGYLMVKDMITQAITPATEAFSRFRAAGVRELAVDLRYNGGGLVSVGRDLASLVAGVRAVGATRYDARQPSLGIARTDRKAGGKIRAMRRPSMTSVPVAMERSSTLPGRNV